MGKMIDPGTPEARRAWLDSLPVDSVVVDGAGCLNRKRPDGWWMGSDSEPSSEGGMRGWCGMDGFWPVRAVRPAPPPALHAIVLGIAAWQTATFGPPGDPLVTLAKLSDEVGELRDELRQAPIPGTEDAHLDRIREEAADVAFLLIDVMRGFGGPDALAAAMAAKLDKNKARTWARADDGKWSGSK